MREVSVRDPGPMARLEDVKADAGSATEVFRLLTDPDGRMTLSGIAKLWRVPRGRFVEWFTTTHATLYDAALKVRADELAHEALEIADEQAEVVKENGETFDPNVQRDKLRADTRLKLAAKWDRSRYGERVDHKHLHVVDLGERLRRASERVIEPHGLEVLAAPEKEQAEPQPADAGGVFI
jgi:hypothetical protein